MAVERSNLSLAGEFAVASELCRRNVYAQLTLGNRKRTDLLVLNDATGRMCRIEVKAKQGRDWPQCRGIAAKDSFLVFVDFAGRSENERADFYVLTVRDWCALVKGEVEKYKLKHPDRRAEITDENVVRLPDEVNRHGKAYEGTGVRIEHIKEHREAWYKIVNALGA
jgi:hypothetical protein